jgi:hypothetical protein
MANPKPEEKQEEISNKKNPLEQRVTCLSSKGLVGRRGFAQSVVARSFVASSLVVARSAFALQVGLVARLFVARSGVLLCKVFVARSQVVASFLALQNQ